MARSRNDRTRQPYFRWQASDNLAHAAKLVGNLRVSCRAGKAFDALAVAESDPGADLGCIDARAIHAVRNQATCCAGQCAAHCDAPFSCDGHWRTDILAASLILHEVAD